MGIMVEHRPVSEVEVGINTSLDTTLNLVVEALGSFFYSQNYLEKEGLKFVNPDYLDAARLCDPMIGFLDSFESGRPNLDLLKEVFINIQDDRKGELIRAVNSLSYQSRRVTTDVVNERTETKVRRRKGGVFYKLVRVAYTLLNPAELHDLLRWINEAELEHRVRQDIERRVNEDRRCQRLFSSLTSMREKFFNQQEDWWVSIYDLVDLGSAIVSFSDFSRGEIREGVKDFFRETGDQRGVEFKEERLKRMGDPLGFIRFFIETGA